MRFYPNFLLLGAGRDSECYDRSEQMAWGYGWHDYDIVRRLKRGEVEKESCPEQAGLVRVVRLRVYESVVGCTGSSKVVNGNY